MMEAVGRRKAHWLFGAGSEKTFSGKKRPQEDMVTSAVFGSIRLMSPEDRRGAIEIILGPKCLGETKFPEEHDTEIELWRTLPMNGKQGPEPDVLLHCGGKTAIVEVKWKSSPPHDQIDKQIEAARTAEMNVTAVMLLGHADVGETGDGPARFHRTWRDVSCELQKRQDNPDTPFGRWVSTMKMFLQETDMGRIFNGLPEPRDAGNVIYRFSKPGHPPWLDVLPALAGPIHYTFGETP